VGLSFDAATSTPTIVAGSPFATGGDPAGIAIDPGGRIDYVSNGVDRTVSVFSIETTTGVLATVAGSPFATGSAGHISFEPRGKFAFVATDNGIAVYSIANTGGALTSLAAGLFPVMQTRLPFSIADPSGAYLFVGESYHLGTHNDGVLSRLSIDSSTGSLVPIVGSPFIPHGFALIWSIAIK
jgi:6-phosphogluconolactonase (cycloisomerase 2 family)